MCVCVLCLFMVAFILPVGVCVCFQELLGVFCHRWGRPHSRVGASMSLPGFHKVGSSGLPAALGGRKAAGQQHSTRGLPTMQCRIPHCLPQTGWVTFSKRYMYGQIEYWRNRNSETTWKKTVFFSGLFFLFFLILLCWCPALLCNYTAKKLVNWDRSVLFFD